MDRAMLEKHLAIAQRHISEGAEHLARQQELIDELAHHNHDTTGAQAVLTTMRETQAIHIADRDRILMELQN
ncbi:hypothetical protein AC629_33420 [Bradyrhizobium sp. NAS80.1]|nr:hypothetical protein AC629_33420 [Bradyrhizobium sp. NAS80.1]